MSLIKKIGIGTIVGVVIAAIVFFLILKFGALVILAIAVPRLTDDLVREGGLNKWLAQSIAVGFSVFMLLGYVMITKFFRSFSTKSLMTLLWACVMFAGYSMTIYYLQVDRAEAAQKKTANWSTGKVAKFARASVDRNTSFFDPVTGDPLVWYYQDEQNRLEFFTSGGIHPQYNVPLKPVDAKTVKQFFAYLDAGKTNMIIGLTPVSALAAVAPTMPPQTNPMPTTIKKPHKQIQKTNKKTTEKPPTETRPIYQVLRQQLSIELGSLETYLCQAQNNR